MKDLAIKRHLDEETRVGSVWIPMKNGIEVFSMHMNRNRDEVIITDHSDYTKIYSVQSIDFYKSRRDE